MTSAERSNTRQPPWVGPESEGTTFGSWLRQQREVRQIGLREIAESSKVSLRYLEAFEQDRFDLLPASVFAKGFLRQYAEYVGLDGDEVINHYLWARQEGSPSLPDEQRIEDRPTQASRESRGLWPVLLLAFLVLAVIVALVLLLAERDRDQPVEQQPRQAFVPPVSPPVPVPPPVEPEPTVEDLTAEPAAPLRVTVEFIRDCWVEAVVDGNQRIAREYSQGESLQIEAQERVVFRKLGNAGGVNLEVNGEPLQLEGSDGQVLSNLTIDLETAAALGASATAGAAP